MDLKNLLGPSESNKAQDVQSQHQKPESSQPPQQQNNQQQQQSAATPSHPGLKHRYSSISSLVNNDDDQMHSSSPAANTSLYPQPSPSGGSNPVTPANKPVSSIKARSSITSLTNETDVDVDGKETPSIARRLSYEVSTSESNSPVIPKKSIPRQPSLQDVMNTDKPIEFEEPVYKEPKEVDNQLSRPPSNPNSVSALSVDQQEQGQEQPKETLENSPKIDSPKNKSKPHSPRSSSHDSNKINGNSESDSRKHSKIENELGKLESLEKRTPNGNGKYKPRRYETPPIWAQKWRPNAKHDPNFGYGSESRFSGQIGDNSKKPSGNVSITGIKPYNDFTRRVTNWIYAQIYSTPKELRQYLELETKFGKIWDKAADRRISLPVTTESILDDSYAVNNTYFKPGLDKEQYERLKKYLISLTKINKDQFKTVKFDQIDRQYREAQRNQVPKHYRLTTDKSTQRIVQNIEKRKLASLFIFNPEMLFDYRLTMSIELPSSENPDRFSDVTPENERKKRRTSIFHDSTSTRFDITDVLQKNKGRNAQELSSLEVELELDMFKLVDSFDRLDQDNITFEDLSETFMDNARILNRELLKPVK